MRIILTGATGYIGKRLLPVLLKKGHHVICCVRDKKRFQPIEQFESQIEVCEVDFLNPKKFKSIPSNCDAAYYLIHSMSSSLSEFEQDEQFTAINFKKFVVEAGVKQVIYLGGIINSNNLSRHLQSRKLVGDILSNGPYKFTTLRAGIIVGSGSASFEIIRDLVEKLPVMIAPKWLKTRSQPIAIRDVISFLEGVLGNDDCYDQSFDIGGPDVMTYKEMLTEFARIRDLKRYIITVPVMSPRLSSYWLFLVTRVSYFLAVNLVDSMKVEVLCEKKGLEEILGIQPISYVESVKKAFEKIEQNLIVSSWKDTFAVSDMDSNLSEFIQVPKNGCFLDVKKIPVNECDQDQVLNNIWSIGGRRGWYYGNVLWKIRGWMDRLVGGVGLRRGRTHPSEIHPGDALDFWRVLLADKKQKRLLLFAEMKLPGEAWLEFKIEKSNEQPYLIQNATFRPKGVLGRLYWYSVLPFHLFVFKGMANKIVNYSNTTFDNRVATAKVI